jgi:hypothetical protein
VYLNGKEVARSNLHPTYPITYATPASSNAVGVDESTFFYEYALAGSDFVVGENLLAVEIHKVSATDDDLSFDARVSVVNSAPATPVVLNQSVMVRVRARSETGEWSGMNSAYFTVGAQPLSATNVVVSELHYHPAAPTRAAELAVSADPDDYEFIELFNISATSVDFTGAFFSAGIDFHFPAGFVVAPGGRCVIVKNAAAFNARYGSGRMIAGTFEGGTGLSNSGETIALARMDGGATTALRSFTYGDSAPWPSSPDGTGPSLVLLNPVVNPDPKVAANWVASADLGGTPALSPGDTTFANWRLGYNDTLDPAGDDDHDGISNALEFVLALHPVQRNGGALVTPQFVTVGGQPYLAIAFRHRATGAGLSLAVESSTNGITWAGGTSVAVVSGTDVGDGTVQEVWRCTTPATAGNPKCFLRLHATLAP